MLNWAIRPLTIRIIRVFIWLIRKAGSWEHLTGSWRETTLHVMVIQIDHIETIIFNDIQMMFSLNIVFHVNNLS